jgi:uncharacterized protein (TIGR02145 family)
MRTKLNKIAQAAALGLAIAFTTSCDAAGNPSALVGRWIEVSGETKGAVMELLSDGTGIVTYEKAFKEAGAAITWKTESGRFYVTASGVASASAYKQQGSQLTFTEDNGKVSEYTKCNKDCKEAAREYNIKAKGIKMSSFTDSRDGKKYGSLKLGTQTWMAENLNYAADGSKCYNNQDGNCQKYGRLYNWATALKACPKGWHLPSDDEWTTLTGFVGDDAGTKLKSTSGWDSNGNGSDDFVFSALPGGYGNSYGGFSNVGKNGYWWSATEDFAANAWYRGMGYDSAAVYRYNNDKAYLFSVRCVQD